MTATSSPGRLIEEAPDRRVGELRVVAPPQKEPGGSPAGAVVRRPSLGHSPLEDGHRRLELVVCVSHAERPLDQVVLDADLLEPHPDPLRAPPVERPPVLGVALRVSRVVDITPLPQLVQGRVDRRLIDPLAVEPAPQLGFRLLTSTKPAKADRQRLLQPGVLAQAARSCPGPVGAPPLRPFVARPFVAAATGAPAFASAGGSIVVTRSFDRPRAA